MKEGISSHQRLTLGFAVMLSPMLRLLPSTVARQAGAAAWVSAALSIVPAAALTGLLWSLLGGFPHGRGLSHCITEIFGKFLGGLILCLWSLWLVFHSGFLLCSGADRFIATIYPTAKPLFFILVMALICAVAARGHIKPLARSGELFLPVLLFVIGLVLLFSIEDVEPTFLLPVTKGHIKGIVKGLPLAAEAVSVALVTMAFLPFQQEARRPRGLVLWLMGATVLSLLLCAVSVGSLGKTYTAALSYPFFVMARDLSVFSGAGRIEALVVGLWLLPDFALITAELVIASDNVRFLFSPKEPEKAIPLWVGAAVLLSLGAALLIAPRSQSLDLLSNTLVPAIHLGWAYGMVPLLWLTGRLRKKF